MPRSFSLIVNPAAGAGRSLRLLPAARTELDRLGVSYQVSQSDSLDHARGLATAAARDGRVVVAVGGDGMTAALAGALAQLRDGAAGAAEAAGVAGAGGPGGDPVFGIIPAGRGNDLARVLGIPAEPAAAARVLAAGQTRPIDLIGVATPGHAECVVAGSVYAGLPSLAGELANASRRLTGPVVYPVAALRVLAAWRPVRFRLRPHSPGAEPVDFPGFAVVVASIPYFGAGMMVAPPARVDDGRLHLIRMRHGSRLAFLRVLLRIRGGTHITLPQISVDPVAGVTLTMDRALPVAADGETLPWARPLPAGAELTIRIRPAALTVLAPPP